MSHPTHNMLARGFSLVEVMVALIVISVGLLGIAMMQALAYSSTGVASLRSLAAIQASSMAAAMHANRGYWAAGIVPASVTVTGNTVLVDGSVLAPPASNCEMPPGGPAPVFCAPTDQGANDLQRWVGSMQAVLPDTNTALAAPNNSRASITCVAAIPVSCTITLRWVEKVVAVNVQGNNQAVLPTTYTLNVEP